MQRARLRQPGSRSHPTPYEYNLAMIQPGTSGRVITPVPVEVPLPVWLTHGGPQATPLVFAPSGSAPSQGPPD